MTRLASRIVAASVVIASLAALSACVPAVEKTFTFADGADLEEGATIEWKDGLADDDGWEASGEPIDTETNSSWSYTSADGECMVSFSRGTTEGIFDDDVDDLEATNEFFSKLTADASLEEISTGAFRLDGASTGVVEMRQAKIPGGGTMAIRVFTDTEVGVILTLSCGDKGDTAEVLAEVIEKNPVVITP